MCGSHSILAAVGLTSAPKSDRMRAKLAIRTHIYKHLTHKDLHLITRSHIYKHS